MGLQSYLEQRFCCWQPVAAEVVQRNKGSITLRWKQDTFDFLAEDLLYKVQSKKKIPPPWVYVYSGGKTIQKIDNLAPCCQHKFRIQVILKSEAVPSLAEKALTHYGSEAAVYANVRGDQFTQTKTSAGSDNGDSTQITDDDKNDECENVIIESVNRMQENEIERVLPVGMKVNDKRRWLESQWSEETCTSTESDGTSATCFCMAVRGGYLKQDSGGVISCDLYNQVQTLLEEKPALIGIVNSTNGFTPLATAVRQGDLNMVKLLLSAGAEVDQRSFTGQTPLHLAVLGAHRALVEVLLDKGANFQARDINELRVEHCAVDSGKLSMVRLIHERGGDVAVRDNNGWTPLFRA
ncbi:ankyrin repeat domain-containing protein 17, partial [Hyposmocoma kahamanoa]|uniref:ankyrin repeat domain-containing protein 17 n=1 Tax=Hyposmocoma kahamanoa TaxID=1477025 RepID=UPI000E6D8B8E